MRALPGIIATGCLAALLSACGSTSTVQNTPAEYTPTAAASNATQGARATRTPESLAATTATVPTATVEPTAEPQQEALRLEKHGFGQNGTKAGFAFIVTNPSTGWAIENSQYTLALYDAAGSELETGDGSIELLLPGQQIAVGGELYLDEGQTAARLEVKLQTGEYLESELLPSFSVENVAYLDDENYPRVRGIIKSAYDRDVDDVRVAAVGYNAAGEIVGGGAAYVEFVLAEGQSPVEVNITAAGEVATWELYPVVTAISNFSDTIAANAADELTLAGQGFSQSDDRVGYGFVVENANAQQLIEQTRYIVAAYDEQGAVLAVASGALEVVLPGQKLGYGNMFYVPADAQVSRFEVLVKAGEYAASDLAALSGENVIYQADDYSAKVIGEVKNPYSKDATQVRVSALVYDDSGAIIGGGYSFLDTVPAGGSVPVEVAVVASGKAKQVELYPAMTDLASLE